MGQAILAGLLRSREFTADRLSATVRRTEKAKAVADKHGVSVGIDNEAACRHADIAVVALKPQRLSALLDDAKMRDALDGKLLISIAAGVRVHQLAAWLPGTAVIRAMPNTPCLIDAGMTVLAAGPRATDEHMATARQIFESVGRVIELDDKHMDAVTSLNGSGPAFAYVMLEALADGGVMMGLPRDVALEIAAQVFLGSSKMVLETGAHPAALKDQVTTPAGSTIAGLLTMEDGRIRSVLARAIQAATKVASGLGDS
jgi:pyrroline-5-carboxylate reductase